MKRHFSSLKGEVEREEDIFRLIRLFSDHGLEITNNSDRDIDVHQSIFGERFQ